MKKLFLFSALILSVTLCLGAVKFDPILGQPREADNPANATQTSYDNDSSGLTAETVQDAIDEVNTASAAKIAKVPPAAAGNFLRLSIAGAGYDGGTPGAVIAETITGTSSKTTPVDADSVPIINSESSGILAKLTWANLKATLKAYFDTLYQAVMTKAGSADIIAGIDDAKYATAKALYDAGIRANVQQIYNYDQHFTINEALKGALITNHGATTDITGTFASGLSAGFWVDVANEAESGGVDGYTKLMLHMDGSDDGTTFTDSSASAHTVTANDNAVTKTGTKKFGTASGYFDGNGDYLSVAASSDWNFGTSDFTIDLWVYMLSVTGYRPIIAAGEGELMFGINYFGDGTISMGRDAVGWDASTSPHGISANTWTHIALVKSGTNMYIFVNGSLLPEMPITCNFSYNAGAAKIGTHTSTGNFFYGYMDEFKISKGIARWTANFTPPNAEYYSSLITLAPASGEQLPGTAAADNTLTSNSKGDVKNFFNTGNSWISKYTTGTWTDGL